MNATPPQVMIDLLRLAEQKGCNTGKLIEQMLRQDKLKWVVDRLQIDPGAHRPALC
eukprot:COSAG01_NODE_15951_length_1283_cov_2.086149_2_plen_56_part_00